MLITSPIIFSRFYLITASRIIPKFIYKKCICDTRTQNNSSTIWTWAFDTIFCVVNHQTLIKTKQTCVRVRVSTQIKPFVIRLHSCKVCLYFTLFFFFTFLLYVRLNYTELHFLLHFRFYLVGIYILPKTSIPSRRKYTTSYTSN